MSCLSLLDELGIADNTIVQYSTDNGPHYNAWPDAGTTPFRSEKNSNWEGAYRVPAFVRWPGHFPAGVTVNGVVAHEDWLPTFASAAGKNDIKEDLLDGYEAIGRTYKNHIDGYDMTEYLSNADSYKTPTESYQASPRKEFWYFNDDGEVRCHSTERLEVRIPREPRRDLSTLARALYRVALTVAVQSATRPVRKGPAQFEHLQRLGPRSPLRDRADAADGGEIR